MVVKNRPASSGEADMIPGSGRAPGGGHDNSHQQSYRENPLDKGACQTKVYWITESDMTEATEHTQYHGQDSLRTSPGFLGGSRAPEEQKC